MYQCETGSLDYNIFLIYCSLILSNFNYCNIRAITTIEADEAVASSDFLKKKKKKTNQRERERVRERRGEQLLANFNLFCLLSVFFRDVLLHNAYEIIS